MRTFYLMLSLTLAFACSESDKDDTGPLDTNTDADADANADADADADDTGTTDADDPVPVDADSDGFPEDEDCDDLDDTVFPGADEVCDGIDNNCDDVIDTDATDMTMWYQDLDGDGYGNPDESLAVWSCDMPLIGYSAAAGDCDDDNPDRHPDAIESCATAFDDNCDGDTNDIDALSCTRFYADRDGDSYGDTSDSECRCTASGIYNETDNDDCDDAEETTHPGAEELCDEVDNDCDDDIDEDEVCGGVISTETITSDGTADFPYCSWRLSCEWDEAMMEECAEALCDAAGYESGTFISSDVDPCTESSTEDEIWVWSADTDEYLEVRSLREAAITAECEMSDTVTLTSDGSEELPWCSWMDSCEWDDEMKDACADALCEASGYESGTFISSDVDPCTESTSDEYGWIYDATGDTYVDESDYGGYWSESVVTAECE